MKLTRILPSFPGGRVKAFTASYDDGVKQDLRLMKIFSENGIKCTYNLNSGITSDKRNGDTFRLPYSELSFHYAKNGNEVAVHCDSHPMTGDIPLSALAEEVLADRKSFEETFGTLVRGMAYPYGSVPDERGIEMLKSIGITYARTTVSTHGFDLPSEPLKLDPTCHHNDPELFDLLDRFLSENVTIFKKPIMFYLWGHAYEFDTDNNWDRIEEFSKKIGNRSDIWYATNSEIIDYMSAYKNLIFSADGLTVVNPTATEIFLRATLFDNGSFIDVFPSVKPGETVRLVLPH